MEWKDGFGLAPEVLEIHCDSCGYTFDPEGKVIRQSYQHEIQLWGKEK